MHHLVAPPRAQQVREHAEAEYERGQDAAAAFACVQGHARGGRHDAYARVDLGAFAALPLAHRQVRHLVAVLRQPLRQLAVPALGAAYRVRVQAVVDDADTHARLRVSGPVR